MKNEVIDIKHHFFIPIFFFHCGIKVLTSDSFVLGIKYSGYFIEKFNKIQYLTMI